MAALSSTISTTADPLDESLKAVDREEREAQQTMVRRDQAADHWNRIYGATAQILTGLAIAAGEEELARRVRPTTRRRAGIAEPPDDNATLTAQILTGLAIAAGEEELARRVRPTARRRAGIAEPPEDNATLTAPAPG